MLRRISPAAGACFVLLIVALTWAAPIADLTAHTYGLLPAMLV